VATADASRRVVLGRILGAHGVRGWLKIVSYTDPADNLLQHPSWMLRSGSAPGLAYQVDEAQFDGRWLRVRLQGIEDRDAAERLRGMEIEVARAQLPKLPARQHYREDLIGLQVRTQTGLLLGRVSHFVEAPSAALMVVRGAAQADAASLHEASERWIPAAPPYLVRVDLERGEIVVDWTEEI